LTGSENFVSKRNQLILFVNVCWSVTVCVNVQATFVIHKESDRANVIECDGIGLNNSTLEPSV